MPNEDRHRSHLASNDIPPRTPSSCATALFATVISTNAEAAEAQMLIDSLRTFGGPLCSSPFWVFHPERFTIPDSLAARPNVRVLPFTLAEPYDSYLFSYKTRVAAMAEELAPPDVTSLVWVDHSALVLKPPVLLDLGSSSHIALRPVHIQNVGLPSDQPLNAYWRRACEAVGLDSLPARSIESFVDRRLIRPYFNCAAYAINPSLGLLRKWWDCFRSLVSDRDFQTCLCADDWPKVFLHQVVFSALIVKHIPWDRIRFLPPAYWYPLHLHGDLAPTGRALSAAETVSVLVHDEPIDPQHPFFTRAPETLHAWLGDHSSRSAKK